MKKAIDIAKLKVLFVSGKIGADKVEQLIERSTTDARINLLKSPIAWYLEEIANEQDIFAMVKKVCAVSDIHFFTISAATFFSICKTIREQTEVIAKIIEDIQYPELNDIQKEAGYGSKHFGTAGLICNLAEAFKIDYVTAEKQPVIALTKLRMNAHTAVCQDKEQKLKKLFEKNS